MSLKPIKNQLYKTQKNCIYCNCQMELEPKVNKHGEQTTVRYAHSSVDHIHPSAKGGENSISNYVLACTFCNEILKGNKLSFIGFRLNSPRKLKEKEYAAIKNFIKYKTYNTILNDLKKDILNDEFDLAMSKITESIKIIFSQRVFQGLINYINKVVRRVDSIIRQIKDVLAYIDNLIGIYDQFIVDNNVKGVRLVKVEVIGREISVNEWQDYLPSHFNKAA